MLNTTRKQPIKVGILEISAQNKAILEYFFSDAGKSYFKEVSLDKASAYIIDYDSLGAKESWKSTFEETKKPGIIISIKEVDLPSTIWLQKPLTVKALKEAGESIREMMSNSNEAAPEKIATIIEEKEEIVESIVENDIEVSVEDSAEFIIEDIIEPQEEIAILQEILQKETPQLDELTTEEVIDIPSEPISQVAPEEPFLEVLENTAELQGNEKEKTPQEETLELDDSLIALIEEDTIEENTEAPEASLLLEEKSSKDDAIISAIEVPELVIADTKASASSSSFAAASNFIDADLSLNDFDKSLDEGSAIQKSSTTPIDNPDIKNLDNESEVDSLLESLISGGKSNKKADKPVNDTTSDSADLIDFDFETLEVDTTKPEKAASELPELTITDTQLIEDDRSSLELENNTLEDPKTGLSDELITTLSSLETTATIDDEKIDAILHGKSQVEEPTMTAEEELQSLLEEIRQEADGTTPVVTNKSGKKGGGSLSQVAAKYSPTNAEERWKLICGDNNTADLQKTNMFDPSKHVIAALIQNIQIAKQKKEIARVKFNGIIVVIDPETDQIYCDRSISSDYYANTCYEPMPAEKIKVHQLDKSEMRLYSKKMKEDAEHTHCIEAFIWTSSLLTARGRLPKNTNIKNKVGLTSWPNLTRVEKVPHMMQIAALFHKNNWSLLEIINKSGIQKNYVLSFYNAALALGIIQTGGEATSSTPLDLKTGRNKNRSLFSRFLKKITV